jgi:hypothetical protein
MASTLLRMNETAKGLAVMAALSMRAGSNVDGPNDS